MSGMGRGAGNTNTELIMQYMNRKYNGGYDIDIILDLIDNYIDGFHNQYEWGYSTPYFLAGSYSAHVNNISYLSTKAGIASRDINFILNSLDPIDRKRYDYDKLEQLYLDYLDTSCDDIEAISLLQEKLNNKDVLILLPGHSILTHKDTIENYCKDINPIVISVNLISHDYPINYAYFSNKNRYNYWRNSNHFDEYQKIVTSNVTTIEKNNQILIDFKRLVKCGFEQLDNSGILLLRLLDLMNLNSIAIAGFDGYAHEAAEQNYIKKGMEKTRNIINADLANENIRIMLKDYMNTRNSQCSVKFITPSRFSEIEKL